MATPKNQSVLKAFAMLRAFRRPDEWLTSVELSRRTNLPEASGYRLIQTLEDIGAVVRGPHGRYRPGMLLVSLSHNVAIGEVMREASHDIMLELAQRLRLVVHMGMFEDGMVTYVAKVGDHTCCEVVTRVGAQLEAYCTGLGKVLLAALPADMLEAFILDGVLVPLTPYTIASRTELRAELEKVRTRGYAIDDQESNLNVRCVAVPIRDADGRTVAAISVTDDAARMKADRQVEACDALLDAAAAISRKVFRAGVLKPA